MPAKDSSEPADDQENIGNNTSPGVEPAAEPSNVVQVLSRYAPNTLTFLIRLTCPAKELNIKACLVERKEGQVCPSKSSSANLLQMWQIGLGHARVCSW